VISKQKLQAKDSALVKSVTISVCGNFGFLGSVLGGVDKYNMQSGLHRKHIKAHEGKVTGITCDNLNRLIVTCALDKTIKFWDFNTMSQIATMENEFSVNYMVLHDDSRFIACSCDDRVIRVIDIDSRKIVREYKGHTNRITSIVSK
jgi:U3 small nucleolar RNA-associated protein 21